MGASSSVIRALMEGTGSSKGGMMRQTKAQYLVGHYMGLHMTAPRDVTSLRPGWVWQSKNFEQ